MDQIPIIPQSITQWIATIVQIFSIALFLYYSRVSGKDKIEEKVIKLLKDQSDAQDKRIKSLEDDLKDTQTKLEATKKELHIYVEENKRLIEIFQGKDKRAEVAYATIEDTNKKMGDLIGMVERMLKIYEPLVQKVTQPTPSVVVNNPPKQ